MNNYIFPFPPLRIQMLHFSINWSKFLGTQGTNSFAFFSMKRQPLEKMPLTHFSPLSAPIVKWTYEKERKKNIKKNFCLWWHFVWNRKYAGEIRKGRVPLLRWFTHSICFIEQGHAFRRIKKNLHCARRYKKNLRLSMSDKRKFGYRDS